MEDSVVEVALILYGISSIAVVVSITASRIKVKYIAISTVTLEFVYVLNDEQIYTHLTAVG